MASDHYCRPAGRSDQRTLQSLGRRNRQQIDAGTLVIDHVESEETSPARDINFDPLVLPDGIAASDDPLLSARSAAYSQSFTRREGNQRTQRGLGPLKPKNEYAKTQDPVRHPVAHPPLVDGSNASGHAVHRRDYGRSLGDYHVLVAIHRPLGIMILILAAIRFSKPDLHEAAAVSAHHLPPGAVPGFVIREVALLP